MLLESILCIFIPPLYSLKKKECNFGIPLCVNYWVYERNFCMVIKSKVLAVEKQVILGHFEQNGASISLIKIAGRNRIFSPLKLIKNLLPLGLEDDELHFNKRPENA